MRTPTTKIVANNEQGFIVINESDFDENKHKRFIPTKEELMKEAERLGVKTSGRAKPETIMEKIKKAESGLIEEDID